jgi:superfamily I DNA and/or RNA helicase
MKITTQDQIVKQVIKRLDERSSVGYKKYGVTLHDDEPGLHKWLNHLQEELLDAANYIEKLKSEVTNVLAEKILKDYLEEDTISSLPDPGPPDSIGATTTTMYPGDINVTYTNVK